MKLLASLFLLLAQLAFAQGSAGDKASYEYRSLIDMQTAGIMKKGYVGSLVDIMPNGTVVAKIEAGVYENLSFGISYGGGNIIGAGNPNWYKLPGVDFRYKILTETVVVPAVSVGFDSQGKGAYFDSTSRYAIKSPGFFAAFAKNYSLLGFLCLHGTVNYSLERKDGDNFINMMIGFEKTIGHYVSFIGEYDFALNDNSTRKYGNGNGYLNLGIRWSLTEGFTIEFDLRDLLDNKKWAPSSADRAIKFEYIQKIFN
jgi:hypothetical protein